MVCKFNNKDAHRNLAYLLLCLPLLPSLALSLYVKYSLVRWDGYFLISQLLGLEHPKFLPLLARLELFTEDLLLAIQICLAVLLVLALTKSCRIALAFSTLSSLALTLVLFIQLQSYYLVGTFSSYSFITAAMKFTRENSRVAMAHVSLESLAKLSLVLSSIIAASVFCALLLRARSETTALVRPMGVALYSSVSIGLLLLFSGIGAKHLTDTPFHQSVILLSLNALSSETDSATRSSELYSLPAEQLQQRYQTLVYPDHGRHQQRSEYLNIKLGVAQEYDIIVVILETAPAALFSNASFSDYPNLAKLASRGIVATKHYTTYPTSNRSIFSIFSSWYPPNGSSNFTHQFPNLKTSGFVHALAARGYERNYYAPTNQRWENDDTMIYALGFERIVYPQSLDDELLPEDLPPQTGIAEDLEALRRLRLDIRRFASEDKRYVAVFAPQIGHGPWISLPSDGNRQFPNTDPLTRGRELMHLQDTWIGSLISELERAKRFDSTIFVITADHGLRTTREYPGLPVGKADEFSYHVPLIISNPEIFENQVSIKTLSSHIDISPSIAELFGFPATDSSRRAEQGVALWDSRLAQRRTFLLGKHFLGVDSLHFNGSFSMVSQLRSITCHSDSGLHFPSSSCVATKLSPTIDALQSISSLNSLQHAWVASFGHPEQPTVLQRAAASSFDTAAVIGR